MNIQLNINEKSRNRFYDEFPAPPIAALHNPLTTKHDSLITHYIMTFQRPFNNPQYHNS